MPGKIHTQQQVNFMFFSKTSPNHTQASAAAKGGHYQTFLADVMKSETSPKQPNYKGTLQQREDPFNGFFFGAVTSYPF